MGGEKECGWGEEVVPGDVGLGVEGDEDEDAEGGREDEHGHVPGEGGVPVRQRAHTGHELKVLHLEKENMVGVMTYAAQYVFMTHMEAMDLSFHFVER